MAITRAQQVRQMLEDGGMLVSPSKDGKRPGYRNPNEDRAKEEAANRREAAIQEQRRQTVDVSKPKQSTFRSEVEDQTTPEDRREIQRILSDQNEQYPGTTEMGEVGVVPVPDKKTQKKLKKTLRDKNPTIFDLLIPSRRNLFKRSLLIPGAKDSITKQRLAYEKYLREKGIDPSEELMDTDDLFAFFDKEAFRNKGQTDYMGQDVMSYGDFLLKEFGNPTVKYRGDIGAYNREMGFERGDNAPVQIANKIITDPTEPTNPNQTTDVFAGIPARFSGSIFDFDALRRRLAEEQSAADGGRIGAMGGGIMDLGTAREAMFLGGIAKGLKKITKKATRAVKKIAKSPIGKAALLGGLGYLGFQGMGGKKGLSEFFFKEAGKGLSFGELLKGGMTGKGMLALGGGLTLAPFLFGKTEEEDDPDPNRGPKLTMEELLAIRGAPFNTLANRFTGSTFAAEGGRIGYQEGSKEPVAKKVMPLLDMGGKEMDLRDNGGFVPIGRMEKADDVPARLSKNEFVFTAEAVRNAGDGDVDKGAEVMYNMMKNLEDGGNVSEESQGLEGARDMFQTAQRLQEII